jgi:hypothetical protein
MHALSLQLHASGTGTVFPSLRGGLEAPLE